MSVPAGEGLLEPRTRRALLRGMAATRERDGDIDVDAVVEMLAGNDVLDAVPLEWVDSVRGELILLLDGGAAMDPFARTSIASRTSSRRSSAPLA